MLLIPAPLTEDLNNIKVDGDYSIEIKRHSEISRRYPRFTRIYADMRPEEAGGQRVPGLASQRYWMDCH